MPKVYLTAEAKERDRLLRRMDKFDAVVTEYMRANRLTTSELSDILGINTSSLWRYRNKVEYFKQAPFNVITKILSMSGCNCDTLKYICGMRGGQDA